MMRCSYGCLALLLVTASTLAQPPSAPQFPDPPAEGEFILDLANVLTQEDRQQIRPTAERLLADKGTPLFVVTVASLADHQAAGMGVEEFATKLLAKWRGEHPQRYGNAWQRGILLLVSRGDRKVRIELAPAWAHRQDADCQRILNSEVLPALKRGDYSTGIRSGVEALNRMLQEVPLAAEPPRQQPSFSPTRTHAKPVGIGAANWWILLPGLAVILLILLYRKGRYGSWVGPWTGRGSSGGATWYDSSTTNYGGGWSGGGSGGGGFSGGAGDGGGGCSGGGAMGSF